MDRYVLVSVSIIVAALIIASSIWMASQGSKVTIIKTVTVTVSKTATKASTTSFIRYEKLAIINAYAVWDEKASKWLAVLQIKNTGTMDAYINDIFINGVPCNVVGLDVNDIRVHHGRITVSKISDVETWQTLGEGKIGVGEEITLAIIIDPGKTGFKHGATIEVKLHTAAASEYPKQVTLP